MGVQGQTDRMDWHLDESFERDNDTWANARQIIVFLLQIGSCVHANLVWQAIDETVIEQQVSSTDKRK